MIIFFLILENSIEPVKKPSTRKNPFRFLWVIKNIASAINKLRTKSKFRPLKFFSVEHFEVLNDQSNFFGSSGKNNDHWKMLLAKSEMIRMAYKFKIWSKKTRVYLICAEKISKFVCFLIFLLLLSFFVVVWSNI